MALTIGLGILALASYLLARALQHAIKHRK